MGPLRGPTDYQQMLGVDEVHYIDEIVDWLKKSGTPCLHVLDGKNSDRCVLFLLKSSELYTKYSKALCGECKLYRAISGPCEYSVVMSNSFSIVSDKFASVRDVNLRLFFSLNHGPFSKTDFAAL